MAKANQPNSQQKPQPDRPDDLNQDQQEPYVPASPVKRTMAWIGIVYMVILLCLTTFYFYTGRMLGNLAPLLTVPGLIGLGALILVSWHSTGHPRRGLALWAEPAVLLSGRLHPAHRPAGSDEQFLRLYYERTDLLRPGGPGADGLRPP